MRLTLLSRLKQLKSQCLAAPGAVGHLDGGPLTLPATTLSRRAITRARAAAATADRAVAVVLVAALPRRPLAKAAVLSQVPQLWGSG